MTDADCVRIVENVGDNVNLKLDITENGDEALENYRNSYLNKDSIFVSDTTYDKLISLWKGDPENLHVSKQFRLNWTDSDENYENDSEDSDFDAVDGAGHHGRY